MSYKKTKASLKSRLSSGDFVQQDFSAAQQGIMAGAGIIAQGMKDKYKERREEEKRKAAAAAKRAADARKAEKEAQKKLRIATSIATRFGIEPTNTEGMTYVMNEVEIHGTGAIDVIQKDYEDGKLQTPTVEITEDYVTGASPNQAPPMRLDPAPDGSPRTTLGLGAELDDLEATDPSAAAAARSANESLYSPQQLNKGEVQTATTTSQGFEFDPSASGGEWRDLLKPTNLDGKTSAEINKIIVIAEGAGATPDDVESAKNIADRIAELENNNSYTKYGSKATSYDNTLAQISLAQMDNAPKAVIDELVRLSVSQQKGEIAKTHGVPGQKVYEAVMTLPDGSQGFKLVVEKPDAEGNVVYYDSVGKPLQVGTDYTFIRNMDENESEAFSKISVQTNTYNMEAQEAKVAIVEGLVNAEQALAFAKNDPRVRNASGDLAQALTNVVRSGSGVLQVMESLFEDKADDYVVTEEQFRAAVEKNAPGVSADLVDAIVSGKVQDLGDQTAMFEASMLSLVFRAGRMEGQAGNAMSNKDFERLSEMLNVKGGIEAFEQTLRTFMADKIRVYDVKANTLMTGPVNDFYNKYGYLPVTEPTKFKDFVAQFDDPTITQAYQNTVSYSPVSTETASRAPQDNTSLERLINGGSVDINLPAGGTYTVSTEEIRKNIASINRMSISDDEKNTKIESLLTDTAAILGTSVENLKKLGGY